MSQRSSESRLSPAKSPRTVQFHPISSQSSRQVADVGLSTGADAFSGTGRPGQATPASMGFAQLPPNSRSPPVVEQTPSRALGVHSILNPSQPDVRQEQNIISQQESTSFPTSFSPRRTLPTTLHAPIITAPRGRKRLDPAFQPDERPPVAPVQSGRRVLTPISPALRASSLGSRRNLAIEPRGNLQALSAPGEPGRYYTAEPGPNSESDIPPLPVSAITARVPVSLPHPADGPAAQPRPPLGSVGQPPTTATHHTNQSPGTSQPSYGHLSHGSPMNRYGMPSASQAGYSTQQGGSGLYLPGPQAPSLADSHYPMGQGSYQMTLDTEHGPMTVPVELDVQQASRVADEKRKRNAGASARFRERRKQKEKEAAHSIATLENEIRDLQDQRDFYRAERDYFRDYARRTPGFGQLQQRPSTPQPRRPLPPLATSSEGPSPESEQADLPSTRSRRRTGDYHPAFTRRQPSASPMPPPQPPMQPLYQSQSPLPPMQSSYADPRSGPPSLPPPSGLPMTRSQSFENPRLPNTNPYDRSWNPGR